MPSKMIANKDYPLVTEVYAVVRTNMPVNGSADTLRDWSLSDAGQTTIEASGYVPLR